MNKYYKVSYGKGLQQDCQAVDLQVKVGDYVMVSHEKYQDLGQIIASVKKDDLIVKRGVSTPLITKKVNKPIPSEAHEKRVESFFKMAKEEILNNKLTMKLIKAHQSYDKNVVTFLFTAEARVDFRMLVKSLSRRVGSRIELRQIGVRDETAILGGFGSCGLTLCCSSFLTKFKSINVKTAKDQGIQLTPSAITGVCGRLKCCLKYEHQGYKDLAKQLPTMGAKHNTSEGPGRVVDINILKQTITVKVEKQKGKGFVLVDIDLSKSISKRKCGSCGSGGKCSGGCRK